MSGFYSADEDRILIGMIGAGCTLADVAAVMPDRSLSSVKHRYRTLRNRGDCPAIAPGGLNNLTPDPDIAELIETTQRSRAPEFVAECEKRMRSGELLLLELALLPPDFAVLDLTDERGVVYPPLSSSGLSDSAEFTVTF